MRCEEQGWGQRMLSETRLIVYNIIMSKNLDEAKLRRMVDKYRKFKAKQTAEDNQTKGWGWLPWLTEGLDTCWCRLVPPCVRDFRGEFELFNHLWQAEMGKPCSNPLISKLSLEDNLKAYKLGQPVVLGLVYSSQSIQKTLNFINNLRVEELKSEVIICPINTQGRNYKNQIEPKIILFEDTVAIFWKGLFNEMILLNKFRMQDASLFTEIKAEVTARQEYQSRIRTIAEGPNLDNVSQELM